MPGKKANVKNEQQYEALKDKGMSKERAAKIANSPGASSRGGKKSGSGGNSSQGGTTAQKKAAGRKGGKATAQEELGARFDEEAHERVDLSLGQLAEVRRHAAGGESLLDVGVRVDDRLADEGLERLAGALRVLGQPVEVRAARRLVREHRQRVAADALLLGEEPLAERGVTLRSRRRLGLVRPAAGAEHERRGGRGEG